MKLLQIIILLAVIFTSYGFPCSKKENTLHIPYTLIQCSGIHSLDQIPNYRVSNYLVLNITNSSIDSLPSRSLSKFPTLSELYLSDNRLKTVAPDGLTNLTNLRHVYLDNNELKVISNGVFTNFKKLVVLNLSENEIKIIENSVFEDTTDLRKLYLQENKIKKLHSGLFANLQKLNTLDLSHNLIDNLQPGLFDSLENLEELDVSNNRLVALHRYSIDSLSKLQGLYFDDNKISSFDVTDLKISLKDLVVVTLDNNHWECKKLTEIGYSLHKMGIDLGNGKRTDVDNYQGIACFNNLKNTAFRNCFSKIVVVIIFISILL